MGSVPSAVSGIHWGSWNVSPADKGVGNDCIQIIQENLDQNPRTTPGPGPGPGTSVQGEVRVVRGGSKQ